MKWMIVMCCALFQCTFAQEPERYELVIHEIFADPAPSRGLPPAEYIEIRNRGNRIINLKNIALYNGSTTGRINATVMLKPDSLLVLCPSASLSQFLLFGPATALSPWPSLNNEGDTLVLLSSAGNVIHSVNWDKLWYGNELKEEGGWSIEMIDHRRPCISRENWAASKDPRGGTPSATNSIASTISDTVSPKLLYTYMPDSISIKMVFSEPLSNVSFPQNTNAELTQKYSAILPPLFNSMVISLQHAVKEEKRYVISGIIATDCSNNDSPPQESGFGRYSAVKPRDLIINEVLFNPAAGGFDYLELFNRSDKVIDASGLFIANRNSGGRISSIQNLCSRSYPLMPGDFLVVTENTAWLKRQYPGREINCAGIISMPSFPDDHGTVVLMDDKGLITDELSYEEKWHFPFISNREGVSLERIRPDADTQDPYNWHSASTSSGYGTPGQFNSQSFPAGAFAGPVTISSPLISPDMDGRDDYTLIEYSFPEPGYVASITIFDSNGVPVNNLVKNALCGIKGHFRWGGMGNDNNSLRRGNYIIVTDVFHIDGKTKRYKNTVGLVR